MQNVIIVSLLFLLLSCQKDVSFSRQSNHSLIGIWEASNAEMVNNDVIVTYLRVEDEYEKYCIIFEENDVFKSHDSGFCGTPPITFHTTEGKYDLDGNLITFDIDHYMYSGASMEIIELSASMLKVKLIR
jgi:hypothetical protein